MSEQTTETHDIEAFFMGGPGEPYYQPFMSCSCGWSLRAETWAEVGAALDAHLEEVRHGR